MEQNNKVELSVINVTRLENKTRTTISECNNSGRVLCDFGNIDKKHASSVLVVHGHLHGYGDRKLGLQLHMRSGVTNSSINDNYSGIQVGQLFICFQHSNDNNSKQ